MKSITSARGRIFACVMVAVLSCAVAVGIAFTPSTAHAELTTGSTVPKYLKIDYFTVGKIKVAIQGTGASQYEYQVALNSKFTKGKKTIKTKATKATFKKLKNGKKYYIRVRAKGGSWADTTWATTPIKRSSTKYAGKWRIIESTNSQENAAIKATPKKKRSTITMTNSGTFTLRGNAKTLKHKWSAFPKYAVMHTSSSIGVCVMNLSKGKLSFMIPSTTDQTKLDRIWRFERVK